MHKKTACITSLLLVELFLVNRKRSRNKITATKKGGFEGDILNNELHKTNLKHIYFLNAKFIWRGSRVRLEI